MAIEIGQDSKCERVPHENVPFFAATSDESALLWIDEGVDWLLMDIEGLLVLVFEIFDVVDMNKWVNWGGYDVLKIIVVLDLGNPGVVNNLFDKLHTKLLFLILYQFLFLPFAWLWLPCLLSTICMLVSFFLCLFWPQPALLSLLWFLYFLELVVDLLLESLLN